jgi:hypothetical protein
MNERDAAFFACLIVQGLQTIRSDWKIGVLHAAQIGDSGLMPRFMRRVVLLALD